MKSDRLVRLMAVILLTAGLGLVGSSCGGGGSGGGGGGTALLMSITIQGVGAPLFTNGQPPLPACPQGVPINSRMTFVFNGPVAPFSLPPNRPGSILIQDIATGATPAGIWEVDTVNPARVFFTATPPLTQAAGCMAGFTSGAQYQLLLPDSSQGNNQVVIVNGVPLTQPVSNVCFQIVTCNPLNPTPSLVDPVAGPPQIASITNATFMPYTPGTATNASFFDGNPGQSTIVVNINEPLQPQSVSSATIFLVNTTSNPNQVVPIATSVDSPTSFKQFGVLPNPNVARVTLTTTPRLTPGDSYQLRFGDGIVNPNGTNPVGGINVVDLGNNVLAPTNPITFVLNPGGTPQTASFMDDFTTANNIATFMDSIAFVPGSIDATFPIEVVGDGSDGAVTLSGAQNINTGIGTDMGAFNYTTLTISPSASLSFSSTTDVSPGESNYVVRLRAFGLISIGNSVVLNCNGRIGQMGGNAPASQSSTRLGGWGGPGGGAGGVASPLLNMVSPVGLPGEGGHIDIVTPSLPGGSINTDSSNPLFGGGGGGQSGMGASNQLAAAGGGGGASSSFAGYMAGDPASWSFTAATVGESHPGSDGLGAGAPLPGQPAAGPPALVPPITRVFGGSGGGGGGDRIVSLTTPSSQAPGGGGGGGGGGLRISSANNITIGSVCQFLINGGAGGGGTSPFMGRGGGGSGGTVLIQAFGNLSIGAASLFRTIGGAGGNTGTPTPTTLNGDGGRGGDGILQFEDSSESYLPALMTSLVTGEVFSRPFALSSAVVGAATSIVIDSGSTTVDYLMASATTTPTSPTGAFCVVRVMGIAENPMAPGQPATTATTVTGIPLMVGPLDLANVNQMNGFRWFRFIVSTSFPPPPMTQVGDPLPSCSDFMISWMTL